MRKTFLWLLQICFIMLERRVLWIVILPADYTTDNNFCFRMQYFFPKSMKFQFDARLNFVLHLINIRAGIIGRMLNAECNYSIQGLCLGQDVNSSAEQYTFVAICIEFSAFYKYTPLIVFMQKATPPSETGVSTKLKTIPRQRIFRLLRWYPMPHVILFTNQVKLKIFCLFKFHEIFRMSFTVHATKIFQQLLI